MVTNQRKAGAVLSYISLVVNAVVSFVYVPILLGSLSTSEYGVYELIGSVIAYLSVMDAGLSTTLSRFYVSTSVSGGKREVENLLAMTKIIYLALTAVAVAAGVGVYWAIDPLFGASFTSTELDLARQMMVLVIVNCAIVLPGNWFLAIINAEERFVFARALSIVKYALQVLAVVAVLQFRSSAMAVLAVQVAVNALGIAAYALYVKGRLRVRGKLHRWDWRLAGSLFSFSFFILLGMVFDQIFWKTGQVVLGAVMGASSVAVYGIACKVITAAYMQVSTGVTSVFLPKLTAISAKTAGMEEINELFFRLGHIQAIMVWGLCAAFAAVGADFIFLWAGSEFNEAYPAVSVLMIGLSVPLVENLGISILQAKNKMEFRSAALGIAAILDLVLSIPAAKYYGVVGCAFVTAAVLLICNGPIMNWYYARFVGIEIRKFWKSVFPLLVPAILASTATAVLGQLVIVGCSWPAFFAKSIAFVAIYFAMLWLGWLNGYEKSLLKSMASRIGALVHSRS
ncbi:oligosaccharide flippase family protein [Arabiibacter massiliensis]|uniref:oligosaccharide flippase family protein n=1 Tax=Arabiibacter massiliensis TaxID=1870985 RepID=UPI0009B96AEC|nr:oligosaccharide flippase family protein [Arabiibacter massiliensis]